MITFLTSLLRGCLSWDVIKVLCVPLILTGVWLITQS